jgi:hypothetical protein
VTVGRGSAAPTRARQRSARGNVQRITRILRQMPAAGQFRA